VDQTDQPVTAKGQFSGVLLAVVSCALFLTANLMAEDQERKAAENRLMQVQAEIKTLQQQLAATRTEQQNEQSKLRDLDLKMQTVSLQSRDLEQQKQVQENELEKLEAEKDVFLASLNQQQAQLVEQIRSAYRLGRQSRLKLLLNQDSTAELSRMLAYYDYVNRAQVDRISGLQEALTTLDAMQQSIDRELIRLDEVQTELEAALAELDRQRSNRQELLTTLASQIIGDEAQLRELQRNQRDLETLIERLADVLADIPADLGQQMSVASGKGQLPMPVTGPVKYAFGQPRAGGIRWQGWLIGAPAGTEVATVAHGRVAFADWLRGYGLMIIIDHGDGFMSLYGQNESLLREVGDWVEPGQPISIVGSGVNNNQGLYFEIRQGGKVVDPAVWLKR
jgi:septal ring factor EnvC (AmiA/AmiB activator)